jgi:hypothetical protein
MSFTITTMAMAVAMALMVRMGIIVGEVMAEGEEGFTGR